MQTGYYLPSNDFGNASTSNGYPNGFTYKANHYGATSDTEFGSIRVSERPGDPQELSGLLPGWLCLQRKQRNQ